MRVPVFIVSFLHLDYRLSPQGSDLPKPFPEPILAQTATGLSCNIWPIITSIKPINFTIVYAFPGSARLLVSFITAMFYVSYLISLIHLCFIGFLSLVLIDSAELQECLINLLIYFTYRGHVVQIIQ